MFPKSWKRFLNFEINIALTSDEYFTAVEEMCLQYEYVPFRSCICPQENLTKVFESLSSGKKYKGIEENQHNIYKNYQIFFSFREIIYSRTIYKLGEHWSFN